MLPKNLFKISSGHIVSRVGAASAAMLLTVYPKNWKSIAAEAAPTGEHEGMDEMLNWLKDLRKV